MPLSASVALLTTVIALAPQAQPPSTTPASPPPPPPAQLVPAVPAAPSGVSSDLDYPDAVRVPAATTNYTVANRPVDQPIDMIVIHDIEGSAESAVRWMRNPKSGVTAHYVVDNEHGTVYQVVREHNIAWHAGNWNINSRSVGIEHAGFAYNPGFYNFTEYEASAKLVRSISTRYNIPRDRTHIIGHFEVPNAKHPGEFGGSGGHTDPGPWWDWDSYMTLVRNDAGLTTAPTFPTVLHPGETATATVTFTNLGDDPWPAPSRSRGADQASITDEAAAQRAKGLVYLGEWNPTYAPLSPESAFYGNGWTSPRYIAPVSTDTAPGAATTFTVTLHGPRTFGPVTEQFRLTKLPVAPHVPVAFGPVLTASVQVIPWDIAVDPTTPAGSFQAPGWKEETHGQSAVYTYEVPKHPDPANPSQSTAMWQQTLPIAGQWDVYVRWPATRHATDRASYQVNSGATGPAGSVVVPPPTSEDQTKDGGQWKLLGRFDLGTRHPATVTLSAAGTSPGDVVTADAVRFVGPFPVANPPIIPLDFQNATTPQ